MQNGSVYPQPGPQEQGLYAYSNGANAGQEVIFVDTTAQEDIFTLTSVGAGSFCAAVCILSLGTCALSSRLIT